MAALNFPTENLQAGVTQYTSDLGTTYIWDGVKWVGHSAGGSVGTNSISNNGNTVQVNADGDLVLPAYTLPNTAGTEAQVLTWPASGTVLEWADQTGQGGGNADLGSFVIESNVLSVESGTDIYVETYETGGPGESRLVLKPQDDGVENPTRLEGSYGVGIWSNTTSAGDSINKWLFGTDGNLVLPTGGSIVNSNGDIVVGNSGSVQYADVVSSDSYPIVDWTIGEGYFITVAGQAANELAPASNRHGYISYYGNGIYLDVVSYSYDAERNETEIQLASLDDADYTDATFRVVSRLPNFTTITGVSGSLEIQNGNLFVTASTGDIDFDGSSIVFPNGSYIKQQQEEGLILWQTDENAIDNNNDSEYIGLWYGGDPGNDQPNVSITAGSYNWSTDDDSLEYVNYPDQGADQGLRQINLDIRLDNGNILNWHLDTSGNLYLPADPDVVGSSGIVFGDGTVQTTAATGGGNGTANRVQFANAGSISQAEDAEPNRYNIVIDAEKDIIFNTDEDSQQFRFTSTGNLQLPQGSTISDQSNSVDITVGRINESPYWYNLFGDTGATGNNNYANLALNGSVVHDSGGNVYVLGSTVSYNNFDSNNLFLKYSPEGNLLWRRTWTDQNGMDCGSYNASLRYIAANVDIGTQDTIVWAAQVPWNNVSYIGTMDTEGNLVDQYGNVRLPTRLDSFRVTDLIWGGNVPGVSDSVVGVVGQLFYPGPGYHFPALGGVDLANAAVLGFSTVMPDGTNLNYGDGNSPPSWVNQYKAVVDVPAHGDNLPFTAAVGTYYDGSYSHAMLSTQVGVGTYTWGIGDNYPEDNIIGEDLCCDTNGNVYVIVNNISSNTSVLIKASAASLDVNEAIWKLSLGPFTSDGFYATAVAYDNGYVYVLGQYSVDATSDTDAILIKVGIANGNVVWQRRIGSPGEDGVNFFGAPGWESSSGINVYDGVIAVSFATEARTPGLNLGPPELNIVTLQYPTDGSLLGSYGDFVISDFDVGNESSNYNVLSIVTALGGDGVNSGFATLQATTASVGTGWTNTQWDMEQNREVYDPQTWKFNYDGAFETTQIRHQSNVKITANTVSGTDAATWTFQNNKGLRFPDGSVQYGAYVETEIALDGGSAVTVFNIPLSVMVADGGGSGSRFGVNDPVYDGDGGNNYVLDGGGA